MKKVVYLIVLMMVGISLQAAQAEASEFLGDVCWSGSSSQTADTFFDLRLGITVIGGGHYALHGLIANPQALGAAISGNAEIRADGSIVASLVWAAKDDTEMRSRIMRLLIQSDLSGVYHMIGQTKVFGTAGTTDKYDFGTVTPEPCQ